MLTNARFGRHGRTGFGLAGARPASAQTYPTAR